MYPFDNATTKVKMGEVTMVISEGTKLSSVGLSGSYKAAAAASADRNRANLP
jgi:hypothetical protein